MPVRVFFPDALLPVRLSAFALYVVDVLDEYK